MRELTEEELGFVAGGFGEKPPEKEPEDPPIVVTAKRREPAGHYFGMWLGLGPAIQVIVGEKDSGGSAGWGSGGGVVYGNAETGDASDDALNPDGLVFGKGVEGDNDGDYELRMGAGGAWFIWQKSPIKKIGPEGGCGQTPASQPTSQALTNGDCA